MAAERRMLAIGAVATGLLLTVAPGVAQAQNPKSYDETYQQYLAAARYCW